ncbi:tRNA pseudouridine(38,39,40) synthase TruA [PVC group bacterium (ex Bugula neritina AB1)]|nr:tRNA pseudouridine(38,39,40) synthase TruA [PVC group bacterium (ex Bugula neritina AB1)]
MLRYHLKIKFCGTYFSGWLKQPQLRTVEGVLLESLESLLKQKVKLVGCSRTDAGVHALEYQVHFDVEKNTIPLDVFPQVLNQKLPSDIVSFFIAPVDKNFHVIQNVKNKTYRYVIKNEKFKDPFEQDRYWHIPFFLDWGLIQEASLSFVGKHDFKSFCCEPDRVKTHIRHVLSLKWFYSCGYWMMEITANGFLYNMIRIIMGTLIDVGRGHKKKESILNILQARDRRLAGPTAPARGLYLLRTTF